MYSHFPGKRAGQRTIEIRWKLSLSTVAATIFGQLTRCESPGYGGEVNVVLFPFFNLLENLQGRNTLYNCLLIAVCVPSITREILIIM